MHTSTAMTQAEVILPLLKKIYEARYLETLRYFPDIIKAGNHPVDKADADVLIAEGFLQLAKTDSFGTLYTISEKGAKILSQFTASC